MVDFIPFPSFIRGLLQLDDNWPPALLWHADALSIDGVASEPAHDVGYQVAAPSRPKAYAVGRGRERRVRVLSVCTWRVTE
jgi:hypothetical protein